VALWREVPRWRKENHLPKLRQKVMASERELIIVQSPMSANYVIAYEGTSGQIPFDLLGEYTSKHLAQTAIDFFKAQREVAKPTKKKDSDGEVSGNSDSK
jgi:hypothetical protein